MKKLKRRLKFFSILAIVTMFLLYVMVQALAAEPEYTNYQNYVVQHGDTLWAIAEKHMPDSDRRKTVYDIRQINELSSTKHIKPGDQLKVPVDIEEFETLVAEQK